MRTRLLLRGLPLLLVALATPAFAQPAPKKPTEPPPEPVISPTATTGTPPEDEAIPPVRPPAKVLSSWREALTLSSAENPDYSIALFEVERLKGVERTTIAGTLPTITATGSVVFNLVRADVTTIDDKTFQPKTITIPASPVATLGLAVDQPLIAPRVWWGIGTAQKQTEFAKTTVEDKKRILIAGVADAIVTVVAAERQAEVNRVSYKAAQDRLRLVKKRKELGAGSDLDIVRFQQDLVSARSGLVTGDEQLLQARERLGLALGKHEGWGVKSDIKIDDIEVTLGKVCSKGDLADRADIRALRQQRDISKRAVTDADLLYAPTADLQSALTYSSEPIYGDKNYSFSIQALLTVPIWDGGARYGIRRSAVAVVKENQVRLDSATRTAKVEVTQAERNVGVAQESLDIAQATRDLAAQTDALVRRSFAEGGNVTSFDLVDAARTLRESELTLTLKSLELIRARISAMLATSNCSKM